MLELNASVDLEGDKNLNASCWQQLKATSVIFTQQKTTNKCTNVKIIFFYTQFVITPDMFQSILIILRQLHVRVTTNCVYKI